MTLPAFCFAKCVRRQAKKQRCSLRSIRKSKIFGGRVMTLPYSGLIKVYVFSLLREHGMDSPECVR